MKKIKYFLWRKFIPIRPAQASCTWGKKHCGKEMGSHALCPRDQSRYIPVPRDHLKSLEFRTM